MSVGSAGTRGQSQILAAQRNSPNRLDEKLIIAHRGASGYLPEHTLAAKALAHAMGADYLEQDVCLTRDGAAVILHDLFLDQVTDVRQRFSGRSRPDGRHYIIDFDLVELETLKVHERVRPKTSKQIFPQRFPKEHSLFRIHTLEQEIEFIQGLNRTTGRDVGIYLELKSPRWHHQHDMDIGAMVMPILDRYGYRSQQDKVFIQSFDPKALQNLVTQFNTEIPLIQLIGDDSWWPDDPTNFAYLRTMEGLAMISRYAKGIGPWYQHIYLGMNSGGGVKFSTLVADAHRQNLLVHPYTLRFDKLPSPWVSFEKLLELLLVHQNVDGVFTDFPDRVVDFLASLD